MTEEDMRALFQLAGIKVISADRLENNYWPNMPEYYARRAQSPWWLVNTPFGFVIIGWRKRVIAIDWSRTRIRTVVTQDDVTKSEQGVHAYSNADAVKYLTALNTVASTQQSNRTLTPVDLTWLRRMRFQTSDRAEAENHQKWFQDFLKRVDRIITETCDCDGVGMCSGHIEAMLEQHPLPE